MSVGAMFMGCTDDSVEGTEQNHTHELRLSLGTHQFDLTRASGEMPTNFETYAYADALVKIKSIQGYLTYYNKDKKPSAGWDKISCIFNYDNAINSWISRVPLKTLTPDGNDTHSKYYFYGFLPKGEGEDNVTITPLTDGGSFKDGAILTLNNLNAVTPDDICVIVGVKGYGAAGNTDVPDMTSPSRLGVFDYYPDTDGDKIFLLVDHIYAGLQFNMKIGTTYSQLRRIKIKSVKLIPENDNNAVIEKVKATVKIVANVVGSNPIVPVYSGSNLNNLGGEVSYEVTKESINPDPVEIFSGEKELTTDFQSFFGCICPATNTKFILKTTYDVYDRKGNPIREGETATNAINLKKSMTVGQNHLVNISVEPTFLYVLSDPDLDNPTFEVN